MSGAVPPISPVTGGAIYEATAKAETAYADAERPADVKCTELQKMASKENQVELTKRPTVRNLGWPEPYQKWNQDRELPYDQGPRKI